MINSHLEGMFKEIFNKNIDLKVKYKTNFTSTRFINNLDTDINKQTTQIGPHRDKYRIFFNGKNIKKYASQGQMKTFIITFIITLAKLFKKQFNQKGVFLLDDIFAELDKKRKIKIYNMIKDLKFQTFYSSINFDFLKKIEGSLFEIKNGVVDKYEQT